MSLKPHRRDGFLRRAGRWIAGSVLILAGLVLAVPGIPGPGFVLVIFGVLVLLPESRWLQRKYVRLRRRYPRVFAAVEKRLPGRARRQAARASRSRRRAA